MFFALYSRTNNLYSTGVQEIIRLFIQHMPQRACSLCTSPAIDGWCRRVDNWITDQLEQTYSTLLSQKQIENDGSFL